MLKEERRSLEEAQKHRLYSTAEIEGEGEGEGREKKSRDRGNRDIQKSESEIFRFRLPNHNVIIVTFKILNKMETTGSGLRFTVFTRLELLWFSGPVWSENFNTRTGSETVF